MTLSAEQMQKVRTAQDPHELLTLAQAEGVSMTDEEAHACFTHFHPPAGELDDEELEAVSGGGCGGNSSNGGSDSGSDSSVPQKTCPRCGSKKMIWVAVNNRYICGDCGRAD